MQDEDRASKHPMAFTDEVGARFVAWLAALPKGKQSRLYVVCDFDGDGLPAGALLVRALRAAGYPSVEGECRRKGESAWGEEIQGRLRDRARGGSGREGTPIPFGDDNKEGRGEREKQVHRETQDDKTGGEEGTGGIDGLIVTDLGVRDGDILPGVPLLLIDHHRPIGEPPGSTVITSYGTGDEAGDGKDVATSGLLCWWCARALVGEAQAGEWLWLAGISILSDLGDKAPFAELAAAKARFGGGALREATSLLNAPRRTTEGRADAALALLMKARGPKEITGGRYPETAELERAKGEVGAALAYARKLPPRFSKAVRDELGADLVAIRMHTGCQVHPLVAQQWRGRFAKSVVFGVNTGYRPGWVTFSGRAPAGVNLIEFLARHRPPEADTSYGLGHNQASGGALPVPVWNRWIREIGFGEEMVVAESEAEDAPAAGALEKTEWVEAGE